MYHTVTRSSRALDFSAPYRIVHVLYRTVVPYRTAFTLYWLSTNEVRVFLGRPAVVILVCNTQASESHAVASEVSLASSL